MCRWQVHQRFSYIESRTRSSLFLFLFYSRIHVFIESEWFDSVTVPRIEPFGTVWCTYVKLAFFRLGVELVLPQAAEHFFNLFSMSFHIGGLYPPPWIPRGSAQNMRIPYGVHTHPCGILTLHLSNSTWIHVEYYNFTQTPRNSAVRVRQGLEQTHSDNSDGRGISVMC